MEKGELFGGIVRYKSHKWKEWVEHMLCEYVINKGKRTCRLGGVSMEANVSRGDDVVLYDE